MSLCRSLAMAIAFASLVTVSSVSIPLFGGSKASASSSTYEVVEEGSLNQRQAIPRHHHKPVLTVSGRVSNTNQGDAAVFDMATLERVGVVRYTTPTAWTPKPVTFEGVLLERLLEALKVPANATTLKMTALNDYSIEIPIADVRKWPVMLAVKADGEYMSVRDKGPVWVVYPRHINQELGNRQYNARWIWQLARIEVR
jgi:hypothetical protein